MCRHSFIIHFMRTGSTLTARHYLFTTTGAAVANLTNMKRWCWWNGWLYWKTTVGGRVAKQLGLQVDWPILMFNLVTKGCRQHTCTWVSLAPFYPPLHTANLPRPPNCHFTHHLAGRPCGSMADSDTHSSTIYMLRDRENTDGLLRAIING